ncbi:hypothetical protein [Acidovorax sp. PRC11]|uniref:hypothetical protein n=1 Tax=Acidovorax sp. PRC11 TaxID=2962592 RepID=UPI00288167DF|nr:hypothetical protein [Acidovorax sp. PRC11]MDT0139485.1 hypothetical protein [Acidovorax sp. PRC11]
MAWFRNSLNEASDAGASALGALVTTLGNWFSQPDFRGCAFLNAAAELGSSDPEILATVRRHKQEMACVLENLFTGGAGMREACCPWSSMAPSSMRRWVTASMP